MDVQIHLEDVPVRRLVELGECLAVVCDNINDVWDFFLEEGLDTDEYDKKTIAEADEVFEVGDGRYLIVEA